MRFSKYQGAGNDFIMIDDQKGDFSLAAQDINRLCDRRFGIGADGLILIRKAPENYDFRMVYFNADGHEGSMCGNGGRCAIRFAEDLGLIENEAEFLAFDGPHAALVMGKSVRLKMADVPRLELHSTYDFVDTGSPHYITFVKDVDKVDVVGSGREIRNGPIFGPSGGTNVNFVETLGENNLKMRTYERGVEEETFACGTGAVAAALASAEKYYWPGPVHVKVKGGELAVRFIRDGQGGFRDIFLEGPAEFVYQGDYKA